MAKTPTITIDTIELDGNNNLWDVIRAALLAKEAKPSAPLLPGLLIFKSHEVVARVYRSGDESRTLLVRTAAGIHKIYFNWYDELLMLYRTSVITLQKMEGTAVVFLGERIEKDAGSATVYAMKWTARQFLQSPPHDATFPATNDSISQPFFLSAWLTRKPEMSCKSALSSILPTSESRVESRQRGDPCSHSAQKKKGHRPVRHCLT